MKLSKEEEIAFQRVQEKDGLLPDKWLCEYLLRRMTPDLIMESLGCLPELGLMEIREVMDQSRISYRWFITQYGKEFLDPELLKLIVNDSTDVKSLQPLAFKMLTTEPLNTIEEKHKSLDILERSAFAPSKFNRCQPIWRDYLTTARSEVLDAFSEFFWETGFDVAGRFSAPRVMTHNGLSLDGSSKELTLSNMIPLTIEFHKCWPLDFVSCYVFCDLDLKDLKEFQLTGSEFRFLSSRTLEKALPTLPWFVLFGEPYLDLFGIDVVRSAPAFKIHELAPDLIGLQLTEFPEDVAENRGRFLATRDACIQHLGQEAFAISNPEGWASRVPDFKRKKPVGASIAMNMEMEEERAIALEKYKAK